MPPRGAGARRARSRRAVRLSGAGTAAGSRRSGGFRFLYDALGPCELGGVAADGERRWRRMAKDLLDATAFVHGVNHFTDTRKGNGWAEVKNAHEILATVALGGRQAVKIGCGFLTE